MLNEKKNGFDWGKTVGKKLGKALCVYIFVLVCVHILTLYYAYEDILLLCRQ